MLHDIALISGDSRQLAFAFVGGFIAFRLLLPPLVGYLLAGIAVGPFTVDGRITSGHDGRIGDRSLEWHTRSEFVSLREMHF